MTTDENTDLSSLSEKNLVMFHTFEDDTMCCNSLNPTKTLKIHQVYDCGKTNEFEFLLFSYYK